MNGHAQAALDGKEGSERARADFENGTTVNPFPYGTTQHMVWGQVMKALANRRDCIAIHDQTKCCWEHDRHTLRWNRSHWGITSCPDCEAEAEIERAKRARGASDD